MAKRKRDYKAEYARRIAKATASGKTRQQARGHKPKEHIERARRAKAKYGVAPSTLTRLRKRAYERLKSLYEKTARNPISDRTIKRGMKLLHHEDLRNLIDMDQIDILSAVKIQDTYLEQLAEYFPASIDDIEGASHNPLWYHR